MTSRSEVLAGKSLQDLRLLRAALSNRDTVRVRGTDVTYDDIMDELHRREKGKDMDETIRVTQVGNCMTTPPVKEGYVVRFVACHGHGPEDKVTWTYRKEKAS